MSELTWCPKCGMDLSSEDFEAGYCPGCGERLTVPAEAEAPEEVSADIPDASPDIREKEPERLVWKVEDGWAVCPRCGAAYDMADKPDFCERCVPDPESPQYVYVYPEPVPEKESVLILTHEESGDEIRLGAGETILGRNSIAGLAGHRYVGRRHAKVTGRDGRFFLCDLDSVNGTKLNGKPLLAGVEEEIRPGDVVELDVERFSVH